MSTTSAQMTDGGPAETAVRDLLDSWLAAVRAGDTARIRDHYANDVVAFDAIQQLQFKGRDAYMRHWAACLEMCPGPGLFELAETAIAANGDLGYSRGLIRCGYTDDDGAEHSSWMRVTTCYRKTGDRWIIEHEHFSAPFDMESSKAIFDATP